MLSGVTPSGKKKPISVTEDGVISIAGNFSGSSGTSSGSSQVIKFTAFASEDISAAGTTTALDISKFIAVTFQCDFTGITSTPIVFHLEGTTDDTTMSWFNLDSEDQDTTRTTNGSYALSMEKAPVLKVRFKYISGSGSVRVKCVGLQYA